MQSDSQQFEQAVIGFCVIVILFLLVAHLDYVQLASY